MNVSVSPRDWELLSAYLDGQLSPKDRAQVEARLWKDAALRNALDELDRTRAAVRQLPRLKAPRNYTLSPQKVKIRPMLRLYPAFGMASALASVILVMVIVVDLLGQFAPGVIPVAQITAVSTAALEESSMPALGAPEPTATELPVGKAAPDATEQEVLTEEVPDNSARTFYAPETETCTPTFVPTLTSEGDTVTMVEETAVWVTVVPLGMATATPFSWQPPPSSTETVAGMMLVAPETPTSTATLTPTETATPTFSPTALPVMEVPTEIPTETPIPTATPTLTLFPVESTPPVASETPLPAHVATATTGPLAATPLALQPSPAPGGRGQNPASSSFTLLELFLAVLALLSAGAALVLRRRSQP